MVTYTYICKTCGTRFERKLSMTQSNQPQSCDCGGEGRKIIHTPYIHYRATGFYNTDTLRSGE